MSEANGKAGKLVHREDAVPAKLTAPADVADRVFRARKAVLDRLTPELLGELTDQLAERARSGDAKATKVIFDLLRPQVLIEAQANVNVSTGTPPTVLRKLAGNFLARHAPASATALANQLEISPDEVGDVLKHEWFGTDTIGMYTLSPAGRRVFA